MRIGSGFDAHRFGEAQVESIKLGGVSVPFDRVIVAHSDGDVILHALCDALLGALALGDIGKHFPDTDPAFKNADSLRLLTASYQKLSSDFDTLKSKLEAQMQEWENAASDLEELNAKLA